MTSPCPSPLRPGRTREDLVRIGSLACIPVLQDETVTDWLVLLPRRSQCVAVTAAARIGGAPVWLLAGCPVPEWVPFEAAYRDIGLIALEGSDDEASIVCFPHKTLPAGDREYSVAAAHGWRYSPLKEEGS